jgi:hypothetical protein
MAFNLIHDPTNPDSYTQGLVAILFAILPWPFIILRIYVRLFHIKCWGLDDTFMIVSQLIYTPYCILNYIITRQVPGAQALSQASATVQLSASLNVHRNDFVLTFLGTICDDTDVHHHDNNPEVVNRILLPTGLDSTMATTNSTFRYGIQRFMLYNLFFNHAV